MDKTQTDWKQDGFLQWAVNDLRRRGVSEEQAWTMVWNTYCDGAWEYQ